jgi:hypothetical protein
MYGVSVSVGTLVDIVREAEKSRVLNNFEEAAKNDFINVPRLNAVETWVSLSGVNHWTHVLVSYMFTLFYLHKKRGQEGMTEIGLLQKVKGVVIHDCWKNLTSFSRISLMRSVTPI